MSLKKFRLNESVILSCIDFPDFCGCFFFINRMYGANLWIHGHMCTSVHWRWGWLLHILTLVAIFEFFDIGVDLCTFRVDLKLYVYSKTTIKILQYGNNRLSISTCEQWTMIYYFSNELINQISDIHFKRLAALRNILM